MSPKWFPFTLEEPCPWLDGVISSHLESPGFLGFSSFKPASWQSVQLLPTPAAAVSVPPTTLCRTQHVFFFASLSLGRRPSQRNHQQKYALPARVTAQGLSSPSAADLALSDSVSYSKISLPLARASCELHWLDRKCHCPLKEQ